MDRRVLTYRSYISFLFIPRLRLLIRYTLAARFHLSLEIAFAARQDQSGTRLFDGRQIPPHPEAGKCEGLWKFREYV
jgi:hypothetical protein